MRVGFEIAKVLICQKKAKKVKVFWISFFFPVYLSKLQKPK